MEILVPIVQLLLFAVPVGVGAAYFAVRGPDAMAGFFGPRRSDPWPFGMQEEDIDHHWGSASREPVTGAGSDARETDGTPAATPVVAVRAAVRRPRALDPPGSP